jgi:hypothetical protein
MWANPESKARNSLARDLASAPSSLGQPYQAGRAAARRRPVRAR